MQVDPRQHLKDMPRFERIAIRSGMTHDQQHRISFQRISQGDMRMVLSRKSGFYTNFNSNLRSTACLPYGKTRSIFDYDCAGLN
jgi:hypothetical protein